MNGRLIGTLALLGMFCVAATANPCAGKKDGTLVAAGSCSATYYQCWQGQPVSPSPQCAAPLVFNPKAKPAGCSFAGALGTSCDCTAYYSGEDLAACNVCKRKGRRGNFPLPGSPSKYVSCTTQKSYVQSCNTGLVWCNKKKNCETSCA